MNWVHVNSDIDDHEARPVDGSEWPVETPTEASCIECGATIERPDS